MIELFNLYLGLLVVSSVAALALSRLGSHLVVRGQVLSTFVLSQVALLGVGTGSLVADAIEPMGVPHGVIELSAGILFCFFCDRLLDALGRSSVARTERSFAIYILFFAANAMLLSVAPGLESHRAQSFFGDPATALDSELKVVLVIAVLCFLGSLLFERAWTRTELLRALSGGMGHFSVRGSELAFAVIRPVLFVSSIFCFGLLWTLAMLFIPPIFLRRSGLGQMWFLGMVGLLAGLGNLAGFGLSLAGTSLPSAPTIAICLGALAFVAERLCRR